MSCSYQKHWQCSSGVWLTCCRLALLMLRYSSCPFPQSCHTFKKLKGRTQDHQWPMFIFAILFSILSKAHSSKTNHQKRGCHELVALAPFKFKVQVYSTRVCIASFANYATLSHSVYGVTETTKKHTYSK